VTAKFLKKAIVKLFCIVNYTFPLCPVLTYDVLPEKLLDCCRGYVVERLRIDSFSEVLNYHDGICVFALSCGQWTYYVSSPSLEGPRWHDELQRLRWCIGSAREFMANIACGHYL
jgi:hypothetical protein